MSMNLDEHDHTKTVKGIALALFFIFIGGYIKDHPEDFRGNPGAFTYGKHLYLDQTF